MNLDLQAATVFVNIKTPPADAIEVYVIGKQWMWQVQHPQASGNQSIASPVDTSVKLIMTSQDVIHSFYIPPFGLSRMWFPVVYTTLWFQATKTGEYHLFCAEYCGTDHSAIGPVPVVVMEQSEFKIGWVVVHLSRPLAVTGERLFTENGCITCHSGSQVSLVRPLLAPAFSLGG
ncbi:MAG: hypothetical protein H6632_03790 [Anaerolineales bacterium]|nr:hypothetical protein [Anaerolineales bacterium]